MRSIYAIENGLVIILGADISARTSCAIEALKRARLRCLCRAFVYDVCLDAWSDTYCPVHD
jgi:hypothetical protein